MLGPDWPSIIKLRTFDWVLGVFVQFASAQERQIQFARLKSLVRPGGRILLHGYTPKQLEYRSLRYSTAPPLTCPVAGTFR